MIRIAHAYPGIGNPYNLSHAMGRVPVALWRATGDTGQTVPDADDSDAAADDDAPPTRCPEGCGCSRSALPPTVWALLPLIVARRRRGRSTPQQPPYSQPGTSSSATEQGMR